MGHRRGVAAAQIGHVLEGIAGRLAVNGAQQGEFGLGAVATEGAGGEVGVEVRAAAGHLHQARVARDGGQHPGLHLVGVGDHQAPPRVGTYGLPDDLGDLECAAAVGGPAAGDRAAGEILGAEAAVVHPLL